MIPCLGTLAVFRRARATGLLLVAVVASAPAVSAQGPSQGLQPPQLLEEATPDLPPDLAIPSPVAVVLRITIDLDGTVTEAEVVEGAGAPFDALAVDALRRSRFRPATRDGDPIAARVLYRWVLAPRPGRAPQPAPAPPSAAGTPPTTDRSEETAPPTPDDDELADELADVGNSGLGAAARVQRDREGILERSVEAVNVVDVAAQRTRARDLGDILAREQGIALQRAGGLGSGSRFSLSGLTDGQVRFFIDGVPLTLYGFDAVANYPVGPVDSIEIFRGVLPVRLGADALGGAVNLRTGDSNRRTFGVASYQVGSWRTHRTSLTARHYVPQSGLTVGFRGFFDRTANNYPIDVEIPDLVGTPFPATVRRFHDDYQAFNGNVDIGVLDRPWARRLQVTLFGTGSNRDRQHNVVQTRPFGEVTEQRRAYGGILRYEVQSGPWTTDVVASFGWSRTVFDDRAELIYGWDGEPIPEIDFDQDPPAVVVDEEGNPVPNRRASPGEITGVPILLARDGREFFARINNRLEIADEHELWLSITPQYATFEGRDRLFDSADRRDPEGARQELGKIVSGLEYRWSPESWGIENGAFVKHYFYDARAEQVLPGDVFRELNRRDQYFGAGNAFRVFLAGEWLWAKASYEYALRLPEPIEVFGDGRFIQQNLELSPERSHNANLGLQLDHGTGSAGRFRGEVNLFLRHAENQIVLLPSTGEFLIHQNVNVARSQGVEASVGWVSPGDWVSIFGNVTYLDFRNISSEGSFGNFDGDRIPNRPYLMANGNASLVVPDLAGLRDELRIGGDVRFVEEFFRGWESQGDRSFKQTVDRQTAFGVFASYGFEVADSLRLVVNFEVLNINNTNLFDFFGVQNPPRTYFVKLTGEYQPRSSTLPISLNSR